jgi:hypothetical protein
MRPCSWFRALFVGLSAAAGSAAWADGVMLGKADTVLVEARPRIASQRAIVKFDGKTETLIVESVLAGPKGEYGWVVPVPSRPSFVKAVKPDYVAGSIEQSSPEPIRLRNRELGLPVILAAVAALVFLSAGFRYRNVRPPLRTFGYLGEAIVFGTLLVAVDWFDPETSSGSTAKLSGGATKGGVPSMPQEPLEVESYGTIGSYDVSVLKGESGGPVVEWLAKRGIGVPKNALRVMDAYAAERWLFLAAQFRKDSDKPLPPHPLKAVFETDRAVYPMRLTGTQEAPVLLELLVVGEQSAHVKGLERWSSNNAELLVPVQRTKEDADVFDEWRGALYAMAKNGQVATYLRGEVQPSQMKEDIRIDWEPYEFSLAVVHDRMEAIHRMILLSLLGAPILAFACGFLSLWGGWRTVVVLPAILITVLGAASIGATWYSGVERIDTELAQQQR